MPSPSASPRPPDASLFTLMEESEEELTSSRLLPSELASFMLAGPFCGDLL